MILMTSTWLHDFAFWQIAVESNILDIFSTMQKKKKITIIIIIIFFLIQYIEKADI